jgi:hypothetical protein
MNFKLGRNRPVARQRRLMLGNYLLATLPPAPPSVDYSVWAPNFLAEVLGNDTLGDCLSAGAFRIGATLLGGSGQKIPFTVQDVINFYSASCGYVPGDPSTDQGGDEETVLRYWQETGLLPGQHKIAGFLGVDGTVAEQVRQAIWRFENSYFGVELPDAWINPFPSAPGFVWDVAGDGNPDNGHCFCGIGYDNVGVQIDSWGMIGTITWAAVAKYATRAAHGDLYTVLGQDAVNVVSGKNPLGFSWTAMVADFDALGGTVKAA